MRRRVLLFNESGCLWGTLRSIFLTPRSAGFALSGGGAQHPKDSCESCQGQRSRFPLALVQTASRASQTECPFLSVFSAPADPLLGLASASFPGYLCVCAKSLQSCCLTLQPRGLQPTRRLCPWDSPGKNTGVGCHALLQGIFSTQGSNLGLLYSRWILYCLSHWGSQINYIPIKINLKIIWLFSMTMILIGISCFHPQ